jgi:ADP-heptose synthase, bifunctional sugar kinase/a denylyltransferase
MNKLDEIRDKVLSDSELRSKIDEWAELKKSIVFTNGVFDIVHLGHIDYLSKAKDEGDILLVGVNSDHSARKLGKGSSRPINNESSRSTIIAAFQFVDGGIL